MKRGVVMVRLIEHKKIIAGCIILILIVFTIVIIMLPQRTTEIKNNIVYMSGYYTEYPDKDDPRYYIEFKNDGTYVLMYDDSRRNEENYDEDGDGSRPIIDMYFGKYKIKNGNFLIKPSEEAGVGFKDTVAVKNNRINSYEYINYENDKRTAWRIIQKSKWGKYQLGSLNADKDSLDKQRPYYTLYNKSDIKKLPSSPEEFRKQFKMDKKAEQERLAEQNR